MVNSFLWKQSNLIECFGYVLLLAPVDVPIIIFSLGVLSSEQCLLDTISEEGFKLDVAAEWHTSY